jgi:hypothetical protein
MQHVFALAPASERKSSMVSVYVAVYPFDVTVMTTVAPIHRIALKNKANLFARGALAR